MSFKDKSKQTNLKMAQHLRTLRLEERYTMRQFAEVLNTPHSFIGKIEKQGRRVDVGEFVEYCRNLGKDPLEELKTIMRL